MNAPLSLVCHVNGEDTVPAGHPPIPADVLPVLRPTLLDGCAPCNKPDCGCGRLTWWHRSPVPWAAVVALHQQGRHDDAVALATLIAWCDRQGSATTADPLVWEVRDR